VKIVICVTDSEQTTTAISVSSGSETRNRILECQLVITATPIFLLRASGKIVVATDSLAKEITSLAEIKCANPGLHFPLKLIKFIKIRIQLAHFDVLT
jgi:hypothetical protein